MAYRDECIRCWYPLEAELEDPAAEMCNNCYTHHRNSIRTVRLPTTLNERMARLRRINWSAVARRAWRKAVEKGEREQCEQRGATKKQEKA